MKTLLTVALFSSFLLHAETTLKENPHKVKAKEIFNNLVHSALTLTNDKRAILCVEGRSLEACIHLSNEIRAKISTQNENIEILVKELEPLNNFFRDYRWDQAFLYLASAQLLLSEASYQKSSSNEDLEKIKDALRQFPGESIKQEEIKERELDFKVAQTAELVKAQREFFCSLFDTLPNGWLTDKKQIKAQAKVLCKQ